MEEKIQYKLEAFEGPLDLLLFLISKHKLNICDVNISELLEQYMTSIGSIEEIQNFEGAAEFIEMAARLVYIKTAMLLPRYEDEGEGLRRELQGELIEYQACKKAAEDLRNRCCAGKMFFREPVRIDSDNMYLRVHPAEDMLKAYLSALGRKQRKLPPPVEAFKGVVHRQLVSVPSRAIILLKSLYKKAKLKWNEIFSGYSRSEKVAMFLAVLELTKSGRIHISDDNNTVELEKNPEIKNREIKEGGELGAGTI